MYVSSIRSNPWLKDKITLCWWDLEYAALIQYRESKTSIFPEK